MIFVLCLCRKRTGSGFKTSVFKDYGFKSMVDFLAAVPGVEMVMLDGEENFKIGSVDKYSSDQKGRGSGIWEKREMWVAFRFDRLLLKETFLFCHMLYIPLIVKSIILCSLIAIVCDIFTLIAKLQNGFAA